MPRVYLPLTLDLLGRLRDTARLPDGVERLLAASEDEVDEYAALQEAADASARLLAGSGRRVVAVAEVPVAEAEVGLSRVVAVHADDADVDPGYLADAGAPDPPELGWWATQEIDVLLGR